jgi:succinoglycan biosynthesis transport protein ExoP
MIDNSKNGTAQNGSNGAVELMPTSLQTWELSPREPHLYDYLLILRKHLWLILTFMVSVVTIVAIATFRMQPVYVATTRIEIDRQNSNILPFQAVDSYDLMIDTDNYIETQSKILTSETMALETIRNSGLSALPQYSSPNGPSEAVATGTLANQKRPPELGAFLASLSVKRVPSSRLMDVSFESTDPQLAARVVNAHIETYVQRNFQSQYDSTTRATTWLRDQLEELKIRVQRSEDARIAYERQNQIWTLDDKQNVTSQRFVDANRELTVAQNERVKRQAILEFAKSGNIDAVPQIQSDAALAEFQRRLTDTTSQHQEALEQFGPNFPKVKRLQAQIKDIQDNIQKEKQNIIDTLDSEYRQAVAREAMLAKELDIQKQEVNQMAGKMVEYNILKREAEGNKVLYDGLLTKLREAGVSASIHSSNIRIVDPAMVPSTPSRPAKARNVALALVVGLVGGIGLALMREYMDNTVKTPDDIETLSRLPSLAVVPLFEATNGNGASGKRSTKLLPGSSSSGHQRMELVAQHLPKSQMSEAFRALRTSLLLSRADHPPQVILVTSALPREGKTTAAANLAVTLAQLGDKTIVVDADLRKPGVGRLLNMTGGNYAGLSSYLAGASSLDLVIVPHPIIPNLAAIPTGPLPPNPADLLSSHKVAEAIAELRKRFKFIVIDSPPVMAATDAVILSVQTDGVLLVVRSGETPKEAFSRTRDLLVSVKCNILGVVLNAVNAGAPDYYYSYRYYPYSYGYGPQEAANEHQRQDHEDIEPVTESVSRDRDDDSEAL